MRLGLSSSESPMKEGFAWSGVPKREQRLEECPSWSLYRGILNTNSPEYQGLESDLWIRKRNPISLSA